jgi:hypothetical protein
LEQGLGRGWMNAFHPDDRLMEEWRAALAAEKPFDKRQRQRNFRKSAEMEWENVLWTWGRRPEHARASDAHRRPA